MEDEAKAHEEAIGEDKAFEDWRILDAITDYEERINYNRNGG